MKEYKSLKGFLERFTLFKLGRLHIRLHKITSTDITPFQHTHPYAYISIVLSGGYLERIRHTLMSNPAGSVIFRRSTTPHRICEILPNTKTLFIAWSTKSKDWNFFDYGDSAPNWNPPKPGIYSRMVFGKAVFCKFDRYWRVGHKDVDSAAKEDRPSVDQSTKGYLDTLISTT